MKRVYVQMCNASQPIVFDDAEYLLQGYGIAGVYVLRKGQIIAHFPNVVGVWVRDVEETEK